jgi:hypothetical protein
LTLPAPSSTGISGSAFLLVIQHRPFNPQQHRIAAAQVEDTPDF